MTKVHEKVPNLQMDPIGVYVQAESLESLGELVKYLQAEKIPCSSFNVGPVTKFDVMRAAATLKRDPQWAVILAFDVEVDRDAQQLADTWSPQRIFIFRADIMYHLKDAILLYQATNKGVDGPLQVY